MAHGGWPRASKGHGTIAGAWAHSLSDSAPIWATRHVRWQAWTNTRACLDMACNVRPHREEAHSGVRQAGGVGCSEVDSAVESGVDTNLRSGGGDTASRITLPAA